MVDALKEVVGLVNQLPHLSMWILVGLLVYKVVIIGSWFGIARLVILKLHDYMTKPKPPQEVIKKIDLSGEFISTDETYSKFMALIHEVKNSHLKTDSKYIHNHDVEWLRDAIKAKREMQSNGGHNVTK